MSRARDQHWLRRVGTIFFVLAAIALVLILSTAIALNAGHSLKQITLALPVLFVFCILTAPLGDWLEVEQFQIAPKPGFSVALTRGPPL
jgi:hypothetical protein